MANAKKPTTAAPAPASTTAAAAPAVATPAPAPAAAKAPSKKPAAAPAASATPATAASAVKKEKPVKTDAAAAAPAAASTTTDAPVEADEEKKGRRVVSKQTVYDEFAALIGMINEQIEKRTQPAAPAADAPAEGAAPAAPAKKTTKRKKDTGVPLKILRSINKRLVVLQGDTCKMMKLKTKTTRDNTKSGLMKPVGISNALFKFLKEAKFDVQQNGQYARVEITRKIHSYVKDNNLRLEKDRRVILPDQKLSTLLNYDPTTAKEEMTYFRLPQYLKPHFHDLSAAASAAEVKA